MGQHLLDIPIWDPRRVRRLFEEEIASKSLKFPRTAFDVKDLENHGANKSFIVSYGRAMQVPRRSEPDAEMHDKSR